MKFINPYKLFVGAFIPNWLLERPEVSQGAKLCYARLSQFAGQKGLCYPKQKTLGQEMGVAARQVRKYINELEGLKLIVAVKSGFQGVNQYKFLEHEWINMNISKGCYSPPLRSNSTSSKGCSSTPLYRRESIEENHIKHNYARSRISAIMRSADVCIDSELLIGKLVNLENLEEIRVRAAFLSAKGKKNPKGYIVSLLTKKMMDFSDSLLAQAKQQIKSAVIPGQFADLVALTSERIRNAK